VKGSGVVGWEVRVDGPARDDDDADEAAVGGVGECGGEGLALARGGEADYFVEEGEGDSLVTDR
jgi:hypothetical protein